MQAKQQTTLYNSSDLKSLYFYFKNHLDSAYECLTPAKINDLIQIITLISIILQTPQLALQLNQTSDISFVALLQILMTKAAMWKVVNAQQLQRRTLSLLKQFKRYVTRIPVKEKDSISVDLKEIIPVEFFVKALEDTSEDKLKLFITFLRIHIMNVASTKRPFTEQWCVLVDALLSVIRRIDNFELIDSVVAIISWLSQKNKIFQEQCLQTGLAYFMVTVIDNSQVSIQFRKKCLQFIRVLVQGNQQALGSLKETGIEDRCKSFMYENPFKNIESLIQPLFSLIFQTQSQQGLQMRCEGIALLSSIQNIPSQQQCWIRIVEFILYAPFLREFIDMSILANNIAELLLQHEQLEEFTSALSVKALQKYLQIESQSIESKQQINQKLFMLISSILSSRPGRHLTYQAIKTLTVLLKKPFSRDETKRLCKQNNIKQLLPKEVEPQDIAMLIIIDQVNWLLREKKEIQVAEVVNAIAKGNVQGNKLEKAEQTTQKLAYLQELITAGHQVDAQTINTVVGLLSTKKNIVMAENSQQEEVQQKVNQNHSDILQVLKTALQYSSASEHLSNPLPINRLIQYLPTASQKSQVLSSIDLIDNLIQICKEKQAIDFNRLYEGLIQVRKQYIKDNEVMSASVRLIDKVPKQVKVSKQIENSDEIQKTAQSQQSVIKKQQAKKQKMVEQVKEKEVKPQQIIKAPSLSTEQQILGALKSNNYEEIVSALNILPEKPLDSPILIQSLINLFIETDKIQTKSQNKGNQIENIETKIIGLLSKHDIKFDQQTKKIITKNKNGLALSLHLKGHSKQIIDACLQSISKNEENCSLQLQILYESLKTKADFEYFESRKIPEKINEMNIKDQVTFKNASLLIGKSSKLRSIQQKYKMVDRLIEGLEKVQSQQATAAIIFALCGLSYENQQTQKQLLQQSNLKIILDIAKSDDVLDSQVIERCAELISNISLKNQSNVTTLSSYNAIQILMKCFKDYVNQPIKPQPLKQILRALGNFAIVPETRLIILSLEYVPLMKKLVTICRPNNLYETMCYSLDVLANLTIQTGKWEEVAKIVIQQGGLQQATIIMREYLMNGDIIKSGLDCIQNVIGEVNTEIIVNKGIVKLLADVLKAHMWNTKIVNKVFRIINKLSNQPLIVENMLETSLPKALHEVICQNKSAIDQKLQAQLTTIVISLMQSKKKPLLLGSGALNCLVAILKFKPQKLDDTALLLKLAANVVSQDLSTSSVNRQMCKSVLLLMKNQTKQSENLVAKGLNLLFLLERDIVIEAETCRSLIQFSSYFLTRSKKIVYETYEYRVRDFLCLLSILISRSSLLRIQMNDQEFMSILENWQKIAKAVETPGLYEAVKLCITCVLNIEKVIGQNVETTQQINEILQQGVKCLLYRRNQSSKQAKIAIQKGQLVAHKFPDGPIKEKYRLPLSRVLTIVSSFRTNDKIFEKSIFHQAGGVFRKPPSVSHCVSIAGYNSGQAKYFDVEFSNVQIKQKFIHGLKAAVRAAKTDMSFSQSPDPHF